jgi:hypothetical protein
MTCRAFSALPTYIIRENMEEDAPCAAEWQRPNQSYRDIECDFDVELY